jgi:exodeoxyribonuclease VII small subunit
MPEKNFDFEKSLQQLEKITQTLSSGDVSLEKAIEHYEQGVGLAGQALKYLNQSEKKVKQVVEKSGQLELIDFENDHD